MTRILEIEGKPVINAKRPIKLTVTKADISKASVKEPQDCAVARACRRELHASEVRVHLGRVYVKTTPNTWTRYMTPKSMRQEIIAFDRGGTFEPQTFELRAPGPSRQVGKRQGGPDSATLKPKKKRVSPHVVTNVRVGPI